MSDRHHGSSINRRPNSINRPLPPYNGPIGQRLGAGIATCPFTVKVPFRSLHQRPVTVGFHRQIGRRESSSPVRPPNGRLLPSLRPILRRHDQQQRPSPDTLLLPLLRPCLHRGNHQKDSLQLRLIPPKERRPYLDSLAVTVDDSSVDRDPHGGVDVARQLLPLCKREIDVYQINSGAIAQVLFVAGNDGCTCSGGFAAAVAICGAATPVAMRFSRTSCWVGVGVALGGGAGLVSRLPVVVGGGAVAVLGGADAWLRVFKVLPTPSLNYPQGLLSDTIGVGFGFDPLSSEYKVIRIAQLHEDDDDDVGYVFHSVNVEIYNLSTNSWREINAVVPFVWFFPCSELLFNGHFHWWSDDEHHGGESILSFHISTEVFQQIQLPDVCAFPDGNERAFLVLNESIALVLYNPSAQASFDIWLMIEYGVAESWTKLFTIGPFVQVEHPLLFWKHELLLEKANGQLVSCDLKSQRLKEFQVYGAQESLRALVYSESLVSIQGGSNLN
ncbi:hypothetical protein RJ640_001783 [Escallonia rubra]|uniref:F-box associated beta-propeller type 1 domain-containing protein n=1 Tax=Escallonia rubra TaxID=112253 RepID=A0AA88QTW0_9ASTE|nr:hypothetical protein RJ640_001783 [Escallonia rubra]